MLYELYTRTVSIFILIPTVVIMLFFSSIIQFLMFLSFVCMISAWEWGKLMKFSSSIHYIWICTMFGLLFSGIIIIQKHVYFDHWIIFFVIYGIVMIWWVFMFLLVLLYPNSIIFWNQSNTLRFCYGIFMILPFFYSGSILRQIHYINDNFDGEWYLLYILVLIWINDSSAYLIGRLFGRHQLLKYVSPQKTWEGLLGGILISIIVSWIFSINISMKFISSYTIFLFFIATVVFSIIGDLTESMFKRDSNVKDTSNLIPGHGGVLDRIDSLIFSIPFFTVLMLLLIYFNTVDM